MINFNQKQEIKLITARFNPVMIGVFGSFARNEETKNSDLDILIDFDKNINLLELIGLEQELSKSLGIKVDLITLKSVNKYFKPFIEKDLIKIS